MLICHAITYGMHHRNRFSVENKEHQLKDIQMYLLQTLWVASTQYIQITIIVIICGCCWWMFVVGPTLFEQLRTVNGYLCTTYREACQLLHLLENDSNWDDTLKDSVISSSPHRIRTLFSIIISTSFPSNPKDLWVKYRDDMSEDDCIVCAVKLWILHYKWLQKLTVRHWSR